MGRIQKQLVGGSILSHDHFQGGHYTFAMAKAPIEKHVTIPGFEDVEAGIVKWPLSVLHIRHKNPERLIDLATHVLQAWRGYTDEAAFVFANTDGEPHNTITPIAHKVEDVYELDLTLRNNITTKEHPLGVYRTDRGNGACSSSGQIKRRAGAFRGIHFIWKRYFFK